jgi:hypothetical protein
MTCGCDRPVMQFDAGVKRGFKSRRSLTRSRVRIGVRFRNYCQGDECLKSDDAIDAVAKDVAADG